jgi:hypothetical protein
MQAPRNRGACSEGQIYEALNLATLRLRYLFRILLLQDAAQLGGRLGLRSRLQVRERGRKRIGQLQSVRAFREGMEEAGIQHCMEFFTET